MTTEALAVPAVHLEPVIRVLAGVQGEDRKDSMSLPMADPA